MLPSHGQNTAAVELLVTGQAGPSMLRVQRAMFLVNRRNSCLPSSFSPVVSVWSPPVLEDSQCKYRFLVYNFFLPWLRLFDAQLETCLTHINIVFSKNRMSR